ncbi:MAG: hypothetical protein J6B68_13230 [Lachnospiraceae bacterium]|nr:hypothetical protein [Lachnospiraceae bacterium]
MGKRNGLFGVVTVLLVMVILFCTSQTVLSQEKADVRSQKKYYAAMEQEYLSGVKQMLTDMGYQNSGVTIRWVTDEEGSRIYTVMIHHQKIDNLSMQEQKLLQEKLSGTEFEDDNCIFVYEFLTV